MLTDSNTVNNRKYCSPLSSITRGYFLQIWIVHVIPQLTLTSKHRETFPIPIITHKICIIVDFSTAYLLERFVLSCCWALSLCKSPLHMSICSGWPLLLLALPFCLLCYYCFKVLCISKFYQRSSWHSFFLIILLRLLDDFLEKKGKMQRPYSIIFKSETTYSHLIFQRPHVQRTHKAHVLPYKRKKSLAKTENA